MRAVGAMVGIDAGAKNGRHGRAAVAAAAGAVVAFLVYFPLVNTDIWWHLAAGREIVTRRAFLHTDPFAYTLDHPRWIDVHWLFQVAAYGLMRLAGPWGLVVAKSIVVGSACALLCVIKRSMVYTVVTGLAVVLFMYEARYLVLMRPVVVTLLCMAAYLFVLERCREGGKPWVLAWLVPVQLLWTNAQGLFALGPVIVGCYLAGALVERVRGRGAPGRERGAGHVALAVCLLSLVAVSCVNPYGVDALALPLKLFGRINPSQTNIFSRNITENMPLLELSGSDTRYVHAVSAVTALLILAGVLGRKVLVPAHLFVWLGFLALAYMAKRNVLLYLFVAAPLVGMYAEGIVTALGRIQRRGVPAVHVALLVALAVVAVAIWGHAAIVAIYPKDGAIAPFRYPVEAVAYLEDKPVAGRLFNADRYGGYLLWELYPRRQVFVDGRMVIRTPAFFAEYLAILEQPALYFDGVAAKFGITHAVLPTAYHPVYMPLVKWLYGSPRWELAFTDGASVVFVREDLHAGVGLDLHDEAAADSIRAALGKRWARNHEIRNEAVIHLERLLEGLPVRREAGKTTHGEAGDPEGTGRAAGGDADMRGRCGPSSRNMLYYETGCDRRDAGGEGEAHAAHSLSPPKAWAVRNKDSPSRGRVSGATKVSFFQGNVRKQCQSISQEALCSCVLS